MKNFKREKYLKKIRGFYHSSDLIKVITGVRRCGKSKLMELIEEELLASGVPEKNIIFIDLDKRSYREITTANQLEALIEEQSVAEGLKYLFIDEIQNVKGFEQLINGFREDGEYSIFITGSNSYLLSGELVTKLTGRYIEFEMFPLSFEEYVQMKQFYNIPVKTQLLDELNSFILEGGFPRAIFFDNLADKRTYTRSVVNEIFEKDIRLRVKIKNKAVFEAVRTYIINNFGATISINSIISALKKNNLSLGKATLVKYIDALTSSKILCECDRFDMKSKRSLSGEKKYYLSDLSFYYTQNTDNRINYGPVLENIFFEYARSMGYSVSVGRIGKLECDFILRDEDMNYSYVQVSYTILASQDTEDREYRPLEKIQDNFPKYVLTTDFLIQKRNGIIHANIIDLMLNRGRL